MSTAASPSHPADAASVAGRARPGLRAFLLLAAQFGLLVLVLDSFQIEGRAFFRIAVLAFFGFLVHAQLPLRLRPPFFVLLSLAGIVLVMGPRGGVWLIGIGLALIALCRLPIGFRSRVGLVLLAGALLVALRNDWLHAPWSGAIWPILGSMFMFRLVIYLYDLKHEAARPSWWSDLSYFFLLPNVCFALFPVIDYKTFRRTYFDTDAHSIYQTGIRWMLRGVVHLLAYRFVYYYGTLAPTDVDGAFDLVRFVVANFALYLRVSGVFHLVIGLLCLFGFHLPETHHNYFLSAGINDFWRRINIYWKDFMLKLFYYPAFFKLRKRGATQALVVATLFVVLVTWALHSYQWFWLRGGFPIHWQDGVFWGALGALMIVNSLYENRHVKARGRRARVWTGKGFLGQSLRIAATFTFICLLWSVWTSKSWAEWLSLWSFLDDASPAEAARLLSVGAAAPLLLGMALSSSGHGGKGGGAEGRRWRWPWTGERSLSAQGWWTAAALGALLLLGTPSIYGRLGGSVSEFVQSMRVARLNQVDALTLQRGYYEDLLNVDRFNSELWMVYRSKPQQWLAIGDTLASQPREDLLLRELVPSVEIEFKGAPLATNRWGMRDDDYALQPPAGVRRVALLGASYVMGPGVLGNETFEAVLERRLNAEGPGAPKVGYEILNFAVAGYSPLQRMMAFEKKALRFEPGWVLYVGHENEVENLLIHLMNSRRRGIDPEYPFLESKFAELGVDSETSDVEFERRVRPHAEEILAWTYRRIIELAEGAAVRPLWVYLPTLEMLGQESMAGDLAAIAEDAGFPVVDLTGVYDGSDVFGLRIADWDFHPNAAGHRLIADRLFDELQNSPLFTKDSAAVEASPDGPPSS